jgi:phosphoglycolate phosphatase
MLFIFDWDGTLCDSTGKIVRSMQQAARQLRLPELEDIQVLNIIGLGLPEAVNRLYPDISPERAEALRAAYSEHFLHHDQTPMPLFDGVEETLHQLRDGGYSLAVATGKSRRGLERVLEGLGMSRFFHGSRCADETTSKPDPHMLLELLAEFRYQAEDAVMVGDTEYDMEMARRARMPSVAVSYGAHHIDRLKPYQPRLCIDRFAQITALVSKSSTPCSGDEYVEMVAKAAD